jgi:hypothetical protein
LISGLGQKAELHQTHISMPFSSQSARSRDCNDLALSFHSKPLAGSLGGLPDFLIGIIGADDGEEAVATAEPVISLQTFAFIKYAGINVLLLFRFQIALR